MKHKNYCSILIGFLLFMILTSGCNQTEEKAKNGIEQVIKTAPVLPSWKEGEAKAKNWIIVSMKNDWNKVFPD